MLSPNHTGIKKVQQKWMASGKGEIKKKTKKHQWKKREREPGKRGGPLKTFREGGVKIHYDPYVAKKKNRNERIERGESFNGQRREKKIKRGVKINGKPIEE